MRSRAASLRTALEGVPQPVIAGVALVLVGIVAVADISAGTQVGFSIFYLMPVLLAAWFGTRGTVFVTAAIAGAAFPVTEIIVRVVYRQPWIPYWNFLSRTSTYLVVGFLAQTLRTSFQHEHELARTDPLTGVLNSRSFYELTAVEIARTKRTGRLLTVACLDLDGFKAVNDQFGHQAGDELLRAVAETLSGEMRPGDLIARMGGDEFALLLPETDSPGALAMLERARSSVRDAAESHGYDVSVSIGAATFALPPDSVDELIWPADQLMYAAKRAGKNEVRLRSFSMAEDRVP